MCTGFAELSYFADREFYQDWWNSTSWDEFSRKWNKPVHTFLLRHVYASSRTGLRLGRWGATFFTFLLSALCHELVMAVVSKKIRPYLFLMQVSPADRHVPDSASSVSSVWMSGAEGYMSTPRPTSSTILRSFQIDEHTLTPR